MQKTNAGVPETSTSTAPLAETLLDHDPRQFNHLESLIEAEQRGAVLEIVSDWHPGDIVDLLIRLPFGLAQRVYDWLPAPTAGRAFAEMKPALLATLLGNIPLPRIVALADVLETDDATDVVAHLPMELARRVLRGLEDEITARVAGALMNGTAVALLLAGLILVVSAVITMYAPLHLAPTAGVSLVFVILLAVTIGAVTPIILNRLGIDPALATGPVITTSNDVLGVLVFFAVATLLYIGVQLSPHIAPVNVSQKTAGFAAATVNVDPRHRGTDGNADS